MYPMRPFLIRWLTTAGAILVTAPLVGIRYDGLGCLLGASLLLGVVNAIVRPVVLLLSLPLIVLTLGFGILIINALMLCFVSSVVPCFRVASFGSALVGAILISIVSWFLSAFFKTSEGRVRIITHHGQVPMPMKKVRGRVIE
jgi:putative membrane protein